MPKTKAVMVVSRAFADFLAEVKVLGPEASAAAGTMQDNLAEYEHGSVDIESVFEGAGGRLSRAAMLRVYRMVCEDVVLSMQSKGDV